MFFILLWAYKLNIDIVSSDFPHITNTQEAKRSMGNILHYVTYINIS